MTAPGPRAVFAGRSLSTDIHWASRSDYKPELARLAEQRKSQAEADKTSQIERMMKDMDVSDSGPSRRGRNPFGPHPRADLHEE